MKPNPQPTEQRHFAIRYGWMVRGKMKMASTVWAGVNAREALNDFCKRNGHVCTAQIVPRGI